MSRYAEQLFAALLLVGAALGIARVQPGLAQMCARVSIRDDAFLLPPPRELRAMALGYDAAATDLLWAKLLVEYGVHWQDKRAFRDVPRYLDGLIALDPKFEPTYQYADTLLLFSPTGAGAKEAEQSRRYLERGLQERPYDGELWLHYGQFLAFLYTSFIEDPKAIEDARRDGALAISRAVALGADVERSLSAASILSRGGEREAAIRHLERAIAISDDPLTREELLAQLARLEANGVRADAQRRLSAVEARWQKRYPYLTRTQFLLLGPKRDAAACAGPSSAQSEACAASWPEAIDSAP